MKTESSVSPFSFEKLNDTQHLEYHNAVIDLTTNFIAVEKIDFPFTLYRKYKSYVDIEKEVYKRLRRAKEKTEDETNVILREKMPLYRQQVDECYVDICHRMETIEKFTENLNLIIQKMREL